MSYILDALKKSERERSLGRVPTLDTVHNYPKSHRQRFRAGLLASALVTLLALLGAGIYGAVFWSKLEITEFVADERAGALDDSRDVPEGDTRAVPRSVAAHETPVARKKTSEPASSAAVSRPAIEPQTTAVSAKKQYLLMDELGEDTRRRLSDILVNVVSFSENPQRRFVMVNQKIYREGQTVNGNLTVVEIKREGAVMRFQGREFLVTP